MNDEDRKALPLQLWLAPAILLILAIAPWPYGFYVFLRLAVCGAAVLIAIALLTRNQSSWLGWGMIATAILYNPIFRVHLERETWAAINVLSAIPFLLIGWSDRRGKLS